MGSRGNAWATTQRNASAISTAVLVVALALWGLYQGVNRPSFVSRENIRAVVIRIDTASSEGAEQVATNSKVQSLEVRLPDGEVIPLKIGISKRAPLKVGDSIPIIQELYDDDSKMYVIDHQEWKVNSWE